MQTRGEAISRSLLLGLRCGVSVLLFLLVSACDSSESRREQEELRDEVATFPAPAHLVMIRREESGIASCVGGDCPRADRYYASIRSVEVTCRDVRRAVQRWNLAQVEWTLDLGSEIAPCSGSGQSEGRALTVSVFNADRLPTRVTSGIEQEDAPAYRSGVVVELAILQ
jgi:hypothetical protein